MRRFYSFTRVNASSLALTAVMLAVYVSVEEEAILAKLSEKTNSTM